MFAILRARHTAQEAYQRIHLFKQGGEPTAAILKALREAGKPCSSEQLVRNGTA
jgi:hypothetical protein